MQSEDTVKQLHSSCTALASRIIGIEGKLALLTVFERQGSSELHGAVGEAMRLLDRTVRSECLRDADELIGQPIPADCSLASIFSALDDARIRETLRPNYLRGPCVLVTCGDHGEQRHMLDPHFVTLDRDFEGRYVSAKQLYGRLIASPQYENLALELEDRARGGDRSEPIPLEELKQLVAQISAVTMQLELLVNQTRYALEAFRTRHRTVAESMLDFPIGRALEAI